MSETPVMGSMSNKISNIMKLNKGHREALLIKLTEGAENRDLKNRCLADAQKEASNKGTAVEDSTVPFFEIDIWLWDEIIKPALNEAIIQNDLKNW